jgi:hypothetical protein
LFEFAAQRTIGMCFAGETVTPSKNKTFCRNGQAVCGHEAVNARHLSAPVVCTISTPTKAWAGCLRGGNGVRTLLSDLSPSYLIMAVYTSLSQLDSVTGGLDGQTGSSGSILYA